VSRYERNASQLIGTNVAVGPSSSSSAPGQPADRAQGSALNITQRRFRGTRRINRD
jgi:hypothetical protein